ncbi:MAG: endonuclease III domain-containing protein, partial [Candidatus Aminicenantales bacterium]
MDAARLRIKPIIRLLRKHYPHVRTALEYANPLQILVATVLAAQSTDKLVNTITPGLFRKYPTAAALARAD